MTTRGLRPCSTPGCPELVTGGLCHQHARAKDAARGSAAARGYGPQWQATRLRYLRDHAPRDPAGDVVCENCGAPSTSDAPLHIDHIDGLGPTGPRGLDFDNLQALCPTCHGIKTAHQTGTAGGPRI